VEAEKPKGAKKQECKKAGAETVTPTGALAAARP